ncbi:MAG: hypothetical protein KGI70_03365 [Patescibacteria group bacterium]|nr:hypothetical protein [Patescibacteria group bacterium]
MFDTDPQARVERIIELVNKDKINRASFRFAPAAALGPEAAAAQGTPLGNL